MNCVDEALRDANSEHHGGNGYGLRVTMINGTEFFGAVHASATLGETVILEIDENGKTRTIYLNTNHVSACEIQW